MMIVVLGLWTRVQVITEKENLESCIYRNPPLLPVGGFFLLQIVCFSMDESAIWFRIISGDCE